MTPWTVARQAPLSTGFSRREHWSGLSCPPPGDLPDPEIEPTSRESPVLVGGFFTSSATWEASGMRFRRYDYGDIICRPRDRARGLLHCKQDALPSEPPGKSDVDTDIAGDAEKEIAAHSSILAWEIPGTKEPGRLQSMESQESDTTYQLTKPPPQFSVIQFIYFYYIF